MTDVAVDTEAEGELILILPRSNHLSPAS